MPDDVAYEKVKALEVLGADVERVRPASIVDKKQASLVLRFPGIATHGSSFSCSTW
jgi:cysteine synthase A